MQFDLPEFDLIDKKSIEDTHELLKLRERSKGLLTLLLRFKGSKSGFFFGGHNWSEIGRHPALIEEYFEKLNTLDHFHTVSAKVRDMLQLLIEDGKI